MNNNFFYRSYRWLIFLVCLVICDIGVKYWIREFFLVEEVVCIAPGINFCYLNNTGLAFGLYPHMSICYRWILICIIMVIIMIFCVNLYRSIKFGLIYKSISYSMIIGGGVGNLCDRILYGSVVDFIDLYIGIWHWPVFNIADIEIFIGILLLLLKHFMFIDKNEEHST